MGGDAGREADRRRGASAGRPSVATHSARFAAGILTGRRRTARPASERRRARRPDASGLVTSRVFPGLVLAVDALLRGDLPEVVEAQRRALDEPAHAAFVERLRKRVEDDEAGPGYRRGGAAAGR